MLAAEETFARLARQGLRRLFKTLLRLPGAKPVWFVGVLMLTAWLPLSYGPTLWDTDEQAREFLSALWQVEAAALGILVAAALFVFQAHAAAGQDNYGLTLTEFVADSGVMGLVGLLAADLTITGSTSLGWGDGAPRGWAAGMALALAAVTLLQIPMLFHQLASRLEPGQMRLRRADRLVSHVAAHLARQKRLAHVQAIIDATVRESGGRVSPYGPRQLHPRIVAAQGGVVLDVDLTQLRATVTATEGLVAYNLRIHAALRRGEGLLFAETEEPTSDANFITLGEQVPDPEYRVGRWLDELHAEGVRQARTHDGPRYTETLDLYWRLFGILATVGDTPSAFPPFGITDTLLHHLYLQFKTLMDVRADQMVSEAAYFPVRLLTLVPPDHDQRLATSILRQLEAYALLEMSVA